MNALARNSAAHLRQVVLVLFWLLSPVFFSVASVDFSSAALVAGFASSALAFAFGRLKND